MSDKEPRLKRWFMAPYRFIKADKWLTEPIRKGLNYANKKRYKYLYGSFYNSNAVTHSNSPDPLKLHADYFVYYFYNKTGRIPGMFQYKTVFPLEGENSVITKQFKETVQRLHARQNTGWPIMDNYGTNLVNNFKVDGIIPTVQRKLMDLAVFRANTPRKAPRSEILDNIAYGVKDAAAVFGTDAIKNVAANAAGGGLEGAIVAKVVGNIAQQNMVKANIDYEKKHNRPHIYQRDVNGLVEDVKDEHARSLYYDFDDKNAIKKIANNIVNNVVTKDEWTIKAASQPPSAARLTPAAGSFIRGVRSFWNNGYKRRYFNRRRYNYNNRRRRFNRRYYHANLAKTWYSGRRFRKYFRRY